MIRSMTGYGKAEAANDSYVFSIEIKSVNHRFLDINIRLPKALNSYEGTLRQVVKNRIDRGKVDIFVTYKRENTDDGLVDYNSSVIKSYLDCFNRIEKEFNIDNNISMSDLVRFPDVLTQAEEEFCEDDIREQLINAMNGALDVFITERKREGEKLRDDLLNKLNELSECVDKIESLYPQILEEYKQKLYDKLKELLGDTSMEESRIVTEVTLYADKICVDEETVRLKSHIDSMSETLRSDAACGKKLDFLTQEMNREANTILSKSNSKNITDVGIVLKTGIEKVREQIQNIE